MPLWDRRGGSEVIGAVLRSRRGCLPLYISIGHRVSLATAIELVLAIIATIVPLNGSEEELSKIPMLIGVIVFVVLGEVVRIWSKRGRTEEYKGLTPALAAERLAEEAAEEAADEAEAPEAKGDAEPEAVPVA